MQRDKQTLNKGVIKMRQDIREYSDSELSMLVFNDEMLYKRRHSYHFMSLLEDIFLFTDGQKEELITDLAEDLNEEEAG